MLVEKVLETFIGKVDAELFETVFNEILKSEKIQNGDDVSVLLMGLLVLT